MPILETLFIGFGYFIVGGLGYCVRMCHVNVEKEVIIVEKYIEKKIETKIGDDEFVKKSEKSIESIIENSIKKIEESFGVNEKDILFANIDQNNKSN